MAINRVAEAIFYFFIHLIFYFFIEPQNFNWSWKY